MSAQTINLTPALYNYLLKVSLREHPVLKECRDETHKLPAFNMQIAPEQGQFMALLVKLIHAKKTLDIGTFTGYSALAVALAIPDSGEVHTCDVDNKVTPIAQKFWEKANVADKIKLHLGNASETLQRFINQNQEGTFDFIFIDADKNNYQDYYEKGLQLLKKGGLMAIDNVLWNGAVIDPDNNDKQTQSIRALNEKIFQDKRVTLSLLPIGDGLTLAQKN